MLLSVFKFKTIQFWAMTRISKTHGINKRLLENNETSFLGSFLLSVSLSLDGKQDDHITEYDSETQIQYFGTSES